MPNAVMLLHMSVSEKRAKCRPSYIPSRPPTVVYPDRNQVAQYREQEFHPTAMDCERIFCINLEGGFFSPASLNEMIVPLGKDIRSGVYGSAVLMIVSSEDSTVEFLEALAQKHGLPIFVSSSPTAPLSDARPVGSLTSTEMETFRLIRSSGGEVTSSRVASLAGIEVNAAVNRLSNLARKGYVQRVARSRREGDAFVDYIAVAESTVTTVGSREYVAAGAEEYFVPEDILEGVRAVANVEGANPGELLKRAWSEFIDRHREVIDSESKEVRQMLKEKDREGLTAFANRHNRERAKRAATRIKRK